MNAPINRLSGTGHDDPSASDILLDIISTVANKFKKCKCLKQGRLLVNRMVIKWLRYSLGIPILAMIALLTESGIPLVILVGAIQIMQR